MSGGSRPEGYTITEALIFLAVSGALFITAMLFVGGRIRQTEFTQGVRDFESRMQDLANNVSTGYYESPQGFTCDGTNTTAGIDVSLSAGATARGSNSGCIFIGQVIQFAPGGDKTAYRVIPVAGKQRVTSGSEQIEVASIQQSRPTALAPGTTHLSSLNDYSTSGKFSTVTVERVAYGSSGVNTGAIGFFSTFGAYGATGLQPGKLFVDVYPIGTSFIAANAMAQLIHDEGMQSGTGYTANKNPTTGVKVCLQSGGASEYAVVTLGGESRLFSSSVAFFSGACPSSGAL